MRINAAGKTMRSGHYRKNLIIMPDKSVFITVSCLLSGIFGGLGIFILLNTPAPLHLLACFCFLAALLPIITWKRYFFRKVILTKDKMAILSAGKRFAVHHISDIKAVTVGMHTIFYFNDGRRYVIRHSKIGQKEILTVNPALPCLKYNGDLRFRFYRRAAAGLILLLFSFCFVTNTDLTYTLCVIAVIGGSDLVFYLVKHLFLD